MENVEKLGELFGEKKALLSSSKFCQNTVY
jgi:hypothetical protein